MIFSRWCVRSRYGAWRIQPLSSPVSGTRSRCSCTRVSTKRRDRWNRSEEHTSELQSQSNLVCRLLLEKKKKNKNNQKDLAYEKQQRVCNESMQSSRKR